MHPGWRCQCTPHSILSKRLTILFFLFLTQLFMSLVVCTIECSTINALRERLSKIIVSKPSPWRQAFQPTFKFGQALRPEVDYEDQRRRGVGEVVSHWIPHRLVLLSWTGGSACCKAVRGIREREMMIMEMSKLSFWKIKQASDCFYITFTHWDAGSLFPSLPKGCPFKHAQTYMTCSWFFSLLFLLYLLY